MSKDYTDGKANLMEIIKQKEREKVINTYFLMKQMEFEKKKNEIEQSYGKSIKNLSNKFGIGGIDFIEEHLQSTNIKAGGGLISNQELKQKKQQIELVIVDEQAKKIEEEKQNELNRRQMKMEQKKLRSKDAIQQQSKLSFIDEEEREESQDDLNLQSKLKRRCFGKNPDDRSRVEEDTFLKKKLIEDYYDQQKTQKDSKVEITYQYWDGSHQPAKMIIKKGNSIAEIISQALLKLGGLYKNLDGAPVEGFMLIKGDYIIPAAKQTHIRDEIFRLKANRVVKTEALSKKVPQDDDFEQIENWVTVRILRSQKYQFDPTSSYTRSSLF
ncbi:protein fam50 homolog [Stylonychia lemnae]|uniref:Protein fam50 homolog n=1 Tax=Stylonychia lemnae TaxID=5949 RepID=A0A077ZRF9_STYLE|nr:protein fam50 homolog [Stylonychia lemnae]|eukprot:CDW71086.1 protein fam50 homolog [Stylonychia lemnae]